MSPNHPTVVSPVELAHRLHADPTAAESLTEDYAGDVGEQGYDLVNRVRPELYGLLAVIIEPVIHDMIEQRPTRPPLGLVNEQGKIVKKRDVQTRHTVHGALASTAMHSMHVLDSSRAGKNAGLMKRADYLTARLGDAAQLYRYRGTVEKLIAQGFGTAFKVSLDAAAAIQRVMRQAIAGTVSDDEIIAAMRRSGTLLRRVASGNIYQLDSAGQMLRLSHQSTQPGTASYLMFKLSPSGPYVDLAAPYTSLADAYSATMPAPVLDKLLGKLATVGCPARIRVDGHTAIDKLWQWVIDVVDQADLIDKIDAE